MLLRLLKILHIISKDKYEYNLIKNQKLFDKKYYLSKNPDVARAGMDPIKHYLKYGWKEDRDPSASFSTNQYLKEHPTCKNICPLVHIETEDPLLNYLLSPEKSSFVDNKSFSNLDVFIITTTAQIDGVYKWRCEFMKKFIEQNLNLKTEIESLQKPTDDFLPKLHYAKLIIYNRPSNSSLSMRVLSFILKYNRKVIMDIDDILIQKYMNYSGRFLGRQISFENLSYNIFTQESCLDYFDKVVVSTDKLKSVYTSKNHQAIIYPNKIDPNIIPKSEKMSSQRLRLIYASGSITHDADFSECYLDLLNFMLKHDDVDLTILGATNGSFDFDLLKNRIVKIPKVSYDEMLDIYAKHDLLLIPLRHNIFNQCKSNIKYIEAASVKTAVLAKNIDEFSSVIKDGKNGFLYKNNFYEKLEEIYEKKETLKDIGLAAYQDCMKFRTTDYTGDCADFIQMIQEMTHVEN